MLLAEEDAERGGPPKATPPLCSIGTRAGWNEPLAASEGRVALSWKRRVPMFSCFGDRDTRPKPRNNGAADRKFVAWCVPSTGQNLRRGTIRHRRGEGPHDVRARRRNRPPL